MHGLSPALIKSVFLACVTLLRISHLNLTSRQHEGDATSSAFFPQLSRGDRSAWAAQAEHWGCVDEKGLLQPGPGRGDGAVLWRLSAAQQCGDMWAQGCRCRRGTSSWGTPSQPQHFAIGKVLLSSCLPSKCSFPDHQTPQTTHCFGVTHAQRGNKMFHNCVAPFPRQVLRAGKGRRWDGSPAQPAPSRSARSLQEPARLSLGGWHACPGYVSTQKNSPGERAGSQPSPLAGLGQAGEGHAACCQSPHAGTVAHHVCRQRRATSIISPKGHSPSSPLRASSQNQTCLS